jgi:hypothetical protein
MIRIGHRSLTMDLFTGTAEVSLLFRCQGEVVRDRFRTPSPSGVLVSLADTILSDYLVVTPQLRQAHVLAVLSATALLSFLRPCLRPLPTTLCAPGPDRILGSSLWRSTSLWTTPPPHPWHRTLSVTRRAVGLARNSSSSCATPSINAHIRVGRNASGLLM